MSRSPDEPQDEFVFDEEFIAAAKFKEAPATQRQDDPPEAGRFARWRAERRRRAMVRKLGGNVRPLARRRSLSGSLRIGPRTLTVLIVLALVGLALLLNYLDPLNLHPSEPAVPTIKVTVQPTG